MVLHNPALRFYHSLVCWWLFFKGGRGRRVWWEEVEEAREGRGRLWPQAEVLITVLAREQKAEGGKDGGTLGPD